MALVANTQEASHTDKLASLPWSTGRGAASGASCSSVSLWQVGVASRSRRAEGEERSGVRHYSHYQRRSFCWRAARGRWVSQRAGEAQT